MPDVDDNAELRRRNFLAREDLRMCICVIDDLRPAILDPSTTAASREKYVEYYRQAIARRDALIADYKQLAPLVSTLYQDQPALYSFVDILPESGLEILETSPKPQKTRRRQRER